MIVRARFSSFVLVLLVAIIAAACGQASFSPTAPSSTPSASAVAGAVITGTVSGASSQAASTTDSFRAASTGTITVTVAGTNVSTTLNSTGRFTLNGVPGGTVQLRFSGSGVDATITLSGVGADDRIDITVTLQGGSARVDHERREHKDHNRSEVSGRIAAVDTAARTIRVGERLIEVPAVAIIRHGSRTLTFADLHVGDKVEIHATVDGTRLIAREVKVQTAEHEDDDADDDDDASDTEVEGVVSGLSGTCPAITFTVGSTKVTATSATRYHESVCTDVKNAVKVEVEGHRQADGSIAAVKIHLED